MTDLTPKQIVAELDKFIVGQAEAKRAVAVAIRNRWRRQHLPADLAGDVAPRNIVMAGPTGVGKTEIARRLASLTGAPFIKVEATKFTEVGYHGRDVESIIRDLTDVAVSLVRSEMTEQVREQARRHAEDRLLDKLLPARESSGLMDEEEKARRQRTREKMRQQLDSGLLDDSEIEIDVERRGNVVGMLGGPGGGFEMDVEMQSMLEKMMPTRRETKRMKVSEAREVLTQQEAEKLVDKEGITRTAIERTEQGGIVFLDEIDKVAGGDKSRSGGPDVSRQGVQRDLLPIVEGSTVITKHGPVKTDHILFIAAGAFHASKVSDLMPELQGRFPIRVELKDLTKEDFVRILREPRNALTEQQKQLLATEGVTIEFTDDAIDAMAQIASDVNRRTQNVGARRLYTIVERVFEELSFEAPDRRGETIRVDADYVRRQLGEIVQDEDLSRFIL